MSMKSFAVIVTFLFFLYETVRIVLYITFSLKTEIQFLIDISTSVLTEH